MRLSGEPFMEHPLQTAYILAELQLDASSLAAALLHDIPEDTGLPIADIEAKFGPEVAKLVDGITKLGKVSLIHLRARRSAPRRRKTCGKCWWPWRKTCGWSLSSWRTDCITCAPWMPCPKERQLKNAQETLEIFAPLAHRLGIWELKWQLEDLSFRYLQPEQYQQIARLVDLPAYRAGEIYRPGYRDAEKRV